MDPFNLPISTVVNRVVPKNAFDPYTNTRQRKQFTDLIQRMTWTNKLSLETVNLDGEDIKEIQIFQVDLKVRQEIEGVLTVIDRAIPYPIIFMVVWKDEMYLSTSAKHPHPGNEDNAVIDWTFKSDWFPVEENLFEVRLKRGLDEVYLDFCVQLTGSSNSGNHSLGELVRLNLDIDVLQKEVEKLNKAISSGIQFKQKVELNIELARVSKLLSEFKKKL